MSLEKNLNTRKIMKKQMVNLMSILVAILFFSLPTFAQKTENRSVGSFNAVKISGDFNVIIQQGGSESVQISASGIDLQDIITEIEGGSLRIRTRNDNWSWKKDYDVDIVLTYKTLEGVTSSGSSRITTKNTIKSDNFDLTLSGSGKFKGSIETQKLEMTISGSGDIELSGSAKAQDVNISGSGDLEAIELKSSFAKIKISGSGNASVAVSEELDAKVSGSGDVRFAGNPQKQIFKTTGSGSIRKINR
jgi:outer membrane lipoprotein-sorting protein